jgi:hypothetical protein
MLGKRYEAYVTVPTSPDSWRIADELEPELKELRVRLERVVEKLHDLSHSAAA